MTGKQLKFYQLFSAFSKADVSKSATIDKYIAAFLDLDFVLAGEVWEFLILEYESAIGQEAAALHFCDRVFALFADANYQKTAKLVAENAAIRRAVYQYSPTAHTGAAFDILNALLFSNKTAEAEEVFKCILKNTVMPVTFGAMLKDQMEKLYTLILKKNPSKKIEMSRKLTALLSSYIAKIKTGEKAILEQRLKETL